MGEPVSDPKPSPTECGQQDPYVYLDLDVLPGDKQTVSFADIPCSKVRAVVATKQNHCDAQTKQNAVKGTLWATKSFYVRKVLQVQKRGQGT